MSSARERRCGLCSRRLVSDIEIEILNHVDQELTEQMYDTRPWLCPACLPHRARNAIADVWESERLAIKPVWSNPFRSK